MTSVSIVGNDGVTFTFGDDEIDEVTERISAAPEVQSVAGSGPMGSFAYDFEGGVKTIMVRGSLIDQATTRTSSGTTTTILQQKQWLEKQINGGQSLRTFASDYCSQSYTGSAFSTTKVLVQNIEFSQRTGIPQELPFSITLVVGGI